MKKNILIISKNRGVTLVELLLSMLIFTILATGVVGFLRNMLKTSREQTLLLSNIDQARLVISRFTNEIRNASYGNDGSYPINLAGDSQIIFFTAYNNGTTTTNRIRYYLSGNTLYRGVTVPSGSPAIYNLSTEKVSAVDNNLQNASTTLFYYYDGNYNGSSTPLTQPINLNQIKFVRMNLFLNRQNNSNASSTYIISGGANIRNLKTNLGN